MGTLIYLTGVVMHWQGNDQLLCCNRLCEKEKAAGLALCRLALLQSIGQSTPALGGLSRSSSLLKGCILRRELTLENLTSFAAAAALACLHMHSAGPHVSKLCRYCQKYSSVRLTKSFLASHCQWEMSLCLSHHLPKCSAALKLLAQSLLIATLLVFASMHSHIHDYVHYFRHSAIPASSSSSIGRACLNLSCAVSMRLGSELSCSASST